MIDVVAVFVIAFLLRSWLIIKYKWVGSDTFWHLLMARELRLGKDINRKSTKFAERSPYYPPLWHALLRLFPERAHRYLGFLPVGFDLLNMLLLFTIVSLFFPYTTLTAGALLVYAVCPILVLVNLNVSPRSVSNLILTSSLLVLFLYFVSGGLVYLLIYSFVTSLIHIANRLATQSVILLSVVSSIFFFDALPVVFLLLSFMISLIITNGYYANVFREHIKKLRLHFRHGDLVRGIRFESPIRIVASFPFLLFVLAFVSVLPWTMPYSFFSVWFLSSLAASFLWVWGDGYLYIAGAVFPGSLLAGLMLIQNSVLAVPVFALLLAASLIVSLRIILQYKNNRVVGKALLSCFYYVNQNGREKDVVVVYPFLFFRAASYFLKMWVIAGSNLDKSTIKKCGVVLSEKIDWIVSGNSEFASNRIFKCVYSSGNYSVFRRRDHGKGKAPGKSRNRS